MRAGDQKLPEELVSFILGQRDYREAIKLLQSKPRVFSDLFVKYGNHSLVARIEPCLLDYWICTTDAKDHVYEAKVRAENPGISEAELLLKLTEAKR